MDQIKQIAEKYRKSNGIINWKKAYEDLGKLTEQSQNKVKELENTIKSLEKEIIPYHLLNKLIEQKNATIEELKCKEDLFLSVIARDKRKVKKLIKLR